MGANGRLLQLRARIRAFTSQSLVRSVGILLGGTALANLITAVAMPISTRLYTPQHFSVAAAFSSIVSIMMVVVCLRFDIAVALAEDDEEAADLLLLSLASAFGLSLLLGLFMIWVPKSSFELARIPALFEYRWWLPTGFLIGGAYLALQMWYVRRQQFGTIARSRIMQSVGAAGGQIGLGALGLAPLGLLVGQVLNYGAGALMLGVKLLVTDRTNLVRVTPARLRQAFIKHQRFPRYSIWEAFANAAAINGPVLIIAMLGPPSAAGYVTLAVFLLQVPMALLGNAIQQVFLSGAPEAHREGRIAEYTLEILIGLVRISTAPLLTLGILAPVTFGMVFGAEWAPSGVLVSWMAPWFLMQFWVSPVSSALHVTGRQQSAMALQFFGLLLRAGATIAAGLWWNERIAEAYAVSGLLFYTLYLVVVMRALGLPFTALIEALRKAMPLIVLAGAVSIPAALGAGWMFPLVSVIG